MDTLESQHRALEQLLLELGAATKSGEAAAIQPALKRVRTLLHAHLQLEDTQFYPVLLRLAGDSKNDSLAATAQLFQQNMQRIAEGVMAFFERYDAELPNVGQFKNDLKLNVDILAKRMAEEERTLHPMLRRLEAEAR